MLEVRSEPGQGSTFYIELPAAPPTPTAGRGLLPRVTTRVVRRRTLLHVQGQRAEREKVEGILLARSQVRLLESIDGISGLARARASRPDLILLDARLPDMDAGEFRRRLRESGSTAAVPVLILRHRRISDQAARCSVLPKRGGRGPAPGGRMSPMTGRSALHTKNHVL